MAGPITRYGLMLVVSSPSGAGKTTVARRLVELEEDVELSVSVTTRPKRPSEVDGKHYRFVDEATFERMVGLGDLLEHAMVFGHYYGTPRAPVEAALKAGRDVLFDIDWQGTQQLAQVVGEDLVKVFILPPSTAELERRLKSRAQDSDGVVAKRMAQASDEISHWAEYDYIVVNDEIERSVERVRAILRAERLRRERQVGLADFVKRLRERR
ncbi:MAG: guanylate kinase [Alphaproteobacteria bacterium]